MLSPGRVVGLGNHELGFRHCVQLDTSNPKPEARNSKELPVSEVLTDLACLVLI
jgi:hypothetical protein